MRAAVWILCGFAALWLVAPILGLGLLLPWPVSLIVATGGAAVMLWGTAIVLIRRQTR